VGGGLLDKHVLCPSCRQQNRPAAGYCRHCGAALTDVYQPADRVSRNGYSGRRPVVFALSGVAVLALFVVAGWLARWPSNAKDYRTAWNLGGQNTGSSYSAFAAGFADTKRDVFTVSSVSGDVVAGRLDAPQADGTTKVFGGTYTVAGDVISEFNVQQLS